MPLRDVAFSDQAMASLEREFSHGVSPAQARIAIRENLMWRWPHAENIFFHVVDDETGLDLWLMKLEFHQIFSILFSVEEDRATVQSVRSFDG